MISNTVISCFGDFIHTYYKNNDYLAKMYIRNAAQGTYNCFSKADKFSAPSGIFTENAYMSMNPLRFLKEEDGKYRIKRDKKHVSALKWLYVDLDTYKTDFTNTQILMNLQEEYFGHSIPYPTLIIDSGRGMYLLWHIEEHTLAYNRWVRVQRYLYETLQEFGADGAVVSDSARVLRCIGSINSKSGRPVSIIDSRDYQYTLYEIMQEYMDIKPVSTKDQSNSSKTFCQTLTPITAFEPYYQHLKGRLEDLELLLLKHRDYEGSGRENILFLYRYWQCCITHDPEKALYRTKSLNSRLSCPLPEKELEKATKSAEKGYLDGCKYKYQSTSVISFLNISVSEMKDLKCFISSAQKCARKREQAKAAYKKSLFLKGKQEKCVKTRERLHKLAQLIGLGLHREEICQKLHISTATYYRDWKVLKAQSLKSIQMEMRDKICKKKSRKNVRSKKKIRFSHFFCPVLLSTKYYKMLLSTQQRRRSISPDQTYFTASG